MASSRPNGGELRIVARCAMCHASAVSHIGQDVSASDVVCATCGMTIFDSPLQSDYFNVAMRVPRRGPRHRQEWVVAGGARGEGQHTPMLAAVDGTIPEPR